MEIWISANGNINHDQLLVEYSILHVLLIKIDFYLTLSIYYEWLQN